MIRLTGIRRSEYKNIKYFDNLSDYDCAYISPTFAGDVFGRILARITNVQDNNFVSTKAYTGATNPDDGSTTYTLNSLSPADSDNLRRIFVINGIVIPNKISEDTLKAILSLPMMSDHTKNCPDPNYNSMDLDYYNFIQAYKADTINKYYVLDGKFVADTPNPGQVSKDYIFSILLDPSITYNNEDYVQYFYNGKNMLYIKTLGNIILMKATRTQT